ncbi:MAG: TonB family protein [Rhodanobacteraceae bacterium]|jgi:protein TonB|nr:TonB family protein [Rhodanobacteraceae bacterium]
MRPRLAVTPSSLDWQRVTALGGSFTAHALAAVLIALPLAPPLQRELPRVLEAVFVEPAQPLPPPPAEPLPPTRARPTPQPPARSRPTPAPIAPVQIPIPAPSEAPPTTTPTLEAPAASGAPTDAQAEVGGATRTLAWDGALKLRYPPESLRLREQGFVLLRVLVDADGSAQRVEIERGSGHPRLDAAARDAVRRAHFRPVLQDGRAVAAWGVVPIEFRLERG